MTLSETIRLTDIKAPRVDLVRLPANNAPAPEAGREAGELKAPVVDIRKAMDSATSNKAITVLEQLRQLLKGTPGGQALVGELESYIAELGDEVNKATQQSQQAQVDVAAASAKNTGQAKPAPTGKPTTVKKAAITTAPCKSCQVNQPVNENGLCAKCASVTKGTFKSSSGQSDTNMTTRPAAVKDRNVGAPPYSGGFRRQGPYIFPISQSSLPYTVRKAAALIVQETIRSGQYDIFTAQTVDEAYSLLAEEQWTAKNHPINRATQNIKKEISDNTVSAIEKDAFAPITIGDFGEPLAPRLPANPKSGGTSDPGGSIQGPGTGDFGRPVGPDDVKPPSNNADIMASAEYKPIEKDKPVDPETAAQMFDPSGKPSSAGGFEKYTTWIQPNLTGPRGDQGNAGGTTSGEGGDYRPMTRSDIGAHLDDPVGPGGGSETTDINREGDITSPSKDFTTDSKGNLSSFNPSSPASSGPAHDDAMKDMSDTGFINPKPSNWEPLKPDIPWSANGGETTVPDRHGGSDMDNVRPFEPKGDLGVHLNDPHAGEDINSVDYSDRRNTSDQTQTGNTIVDPHTVDTGGTTGSPGMSKPDSGTIFEPTHVAGPGIISDPHTIDTGGQTDQKTNWNPDSTELRKSKLSSKQRSKLSDSEFAAGDKLPINDANHVRNALARFNQTHFDSPAEKESARRKINAKAKELGIKVSESIYIPNTEIYPEIEWTP